MAAAHLIEKWKTRCRIFSRNGYCPSEPEEIGLVGLPRTAFPSDRTDLRSDNVLESDKDLARGMIVTDERDKVSKSGRRNGMSEKKTGNTSDVENEVHGCLRRMCELDPSNTYMILTGGVVDPRKVMALGDRTWGQTMRRYKPTVAEVIVSMDKLLQKSYRKDARVWFHKSSSRIRQGPDEPMSQTNGSETQTPKSEKVNNSRVVNNLNRSPDGSLAATPPYQVDFPPTPAISSDNISLNISEEQRMEIPDYNVPRVRNYDGYVSDGQEEYHSDYDDADYEKRVLNIYGRSYTDMQNDNQRSRDDIQCPGTPPSPETLENRFNRLKGRTTYCDLDSDYRNQRYDSHLVTRRSVSDHQVLTSGQPQHRATERYSLDDMLSSDYRLPTVPTHEPSQEFHHGRGVDNPYAANRHRYPAFYISDEDDSSVEMTP